MDRTDGRATIPPAARGSERLGILLQGALSALLERDGAGRLSLRYLTAAPRALSLSLPVRGEPYDEAGLLPFFDGLLPEGRVRDQLALRFRLDPNDVFGLLREFGRECAGAVVIVPEAEIDTAGAEGVLWLSDEELERRVADLDARPLADEPGEHVRISLAGAQGKLVVVLDQEGRVGLPRGATPSTHILKPQPTVLRGRRLAFPDLVPNEAFCMVLAQRSGVTTAEVHLRRIGAEHVLAVRRYDRTGDGQRLHQEDFCQALGVPSRQKYEGDGGPGQHAYLDLLARHSADPLEDRMALLERIAFCYLIGNDDMHAKNLALLYEGGAVRLAPAYDLLSTYVYSHLTRAMGTAVNGMYDAEQLRAVHWRKHFDSLGVSGPLVSARFAALAARVLAALPDARAQIVEWGLTPPVVDAIDAVVARRAQRLAELGITG